MELMNEMYKARELGASGTPEWQETLDIYVRMMAPITPHIAEELWAYLGNPYSVHMQPWPEVDDDATIEDEVTLVLQINGKLRDRIQVPAGIPDEQAKQIALASEAVQRHLGGQTPKKVILVSGKLVNIVV
jgi:leucyl-tRNA synthetase